MIFVDTLDKAKAPLPGVGAMIYTTCADKAKRLDAAGVPVRHLMRAKQWWYPAPAGEVVELLITGGIVGERLYQIASMAIRDRAVRPALRTALTIGGTSALRELVQALLDGAKTPG